MLAVQEGAPGVFRVHYRTSSDLDAALQADLVRAVERSAAGGHTAIIFVLEPGIRTVDIAVPTYWLGVTARPELKLAAMAIVTRSMGVRTAAKGFALANTVRRLALEVRTFEEEGAALDWARGVIQRGP